MCTKQAGHKSAEAAQQAHYTLWASQVYKGQICQTEGNMKGRTHKDI